MFEKKKSMEPEDSAGESSVLSCAGIATAPVQTPVAAQSQVSAAVPAQTPAARAADSAKQPANQPAQQPAERMTLDRIEGVMAVCELGDGTLTNIPVAELPDGAREGMVFKRGEHGWVPDADEQRNRRARIQEKMNSLFV